MSRTTNQPTPAVSVIVPVYNAEKTLRDTLQSLDEQTLLELEIIVVDDGSTDNSLSLATSMAKTSKHAIAVLHQENKGPSAARNHGLDNAHGEYFAFVDSDDTVDKTMYEKMYASAAKHSSDIVSCGRTLYDSATGQPLREKVPKYEVLHGGLKESPQTMKRVGQLMCDKLFRRSIVEAHHIRLDEDLRHAEDFLFISKIKLHVDTVSCVQEPLYRWNTNNSASISGGNAHVLDIPIAGERAIKLYQSVGMFDHVSKHVLFVLVGYYLRKCRDLSFSSPLFWKYKHAFKKLFKRYFSTDWNAMVKKRMNKMISNQEANRWLRIKAL